MCDIVVWAQESSCKRLNIGRWGAEEAQTDRIDGTMMGGYKKHHMFEEETGLIASSLWKET